MDLGGGEGAPMTGLQFGKTHASASGENGKRSAAFDIASATGRLDLRKRSKTRRKRLPGIGGLLFH